MNCTKLYYVSGILGLIILSSIIHKGFSCLRALMEFLRSCRHVTEMMETVLRHDLLFVWVLFSFWEGLQTSSFAPKTELCWPRVWVFVFLECGSCLCSLCAVCSVLSLKKRCLRDFQIVLAVKRCAGFLVSAQNGIWEPSQRLLCVQLESVLVFLLLVSQFLLPVHNSEVLEHVFVCASMNSNGLCCSKAEPRITKEVTKRSIVPPVFWGQNTGPCVCLTCITQLHPKPLLCSLHSKPMYFSSLSYSWPQKYAIKANTLHFCD